MCTVGLALTGSSHFWPHACACRQREMSVIGVKVGVVARAHDHLAFKEAALAKIRPYEHSKRTRFQPKDPLLAFVETL